MNPVGSKEQDKQLLGSSLVVNQIRHMHECSGINGVYRYQGKPHIILALNTCFPLKTTAHTNSLISFSTASGLRRLWTTLLLLADRSNQAQQQTYKQTNKSN